MSTSGTIKAIPVVRVSVASPASVHAMNQRSRRAA
jgi:hypothetical protein